MEKYDLLAEHTEKCAFGPCIKARNRFDGSIGCLKVFDSVVDSGAKDFIKKQVLAISQINHQNIIKPYECFLERGKICIFMEITTNGNLSQFCKSPQPEMNILQWARQIARGLAVIHSKQIMHSNIKASNILITKENVLKIADFSFTERLQNLRYKSSLFANDVFNLGIILYQLASGKSIYPSLVNKGKSLPSIRSLVSAELSDLIHKMIDKNPKNRISLYDVLVHPLINLKSSPEAKLLSSHLSNQAVPSSKTPPLSHANSVDYRKNVCYPKSRLSSRAVASRDVKIEEFVANPSEKENKYLTSRTTSSRGGKVLLKKVVFPRSTSLPDLDQESHQDLSVLKPVQSYFSPTSVAVDLVPYRKLFHKFQHWIIASSDFDTSSVNLTTEPSKTKFIFIDKSSTELFSSSIKKNRGLQSVVIYAQIKKLGKILFSNFVSLRSVILPDTVTHIEDNCFYYCLSLSSVSFPSSLIEIGIQCFCGCSSLQSIHLPSSLKVLKIGCFSHCSNLSFAFIPKSIILISSSSFSGCSKLFEDAPDGKPRIVIEEGSKFTLERIKQCQDLFGLNNFAS